MKKGISLACGHTMDRQKDETMIDFSGGSAIECIGVVLNGDIFNPGW